MTPAALFLIVGVELFGGGGPMLAESGWNGQAGGAVRVILPIALFAQVHHTHVSSSGAFPATHKTTSLLAGARLSLLPGPLSPYLLGAYGRGWYSNSFGDEDDGRTLHLGAGVQLAIAPSARLFAEGRFTATENEHADGADLGLPLTVGIVWRP